MDELNKVVVGLKRKNRQLVSRDYGSAEEMAEVMDNYFSVVEMKNWTLTGLCLHLGLSERGLLNHRKLPSYSWLVNEALLKVAHSYELSLRSDRSPYGAIFGLKHLGWSDRIDHHVSSGEGIVFNMSYGLPEEVEGEEVE